MPLDIRGIGKGDAQGLNLTLGDDAWATGGLDEAEDTQSGLDGGTHFRIEAAPYEQIARHGRDLDRQLPIAAPAPIPPKGDVCLDATSRQDLRDVLFVATAGIHRVPVCVIHYHRLPV